MEEIIRTRIKNTRLGASQARVNRAKARSEAAKLNIVELQSNDFHTNYAYLERLTTSELYALASLFDMDVPIGIDRALLICELLETAPCVGIFGHAAEDNTSEVVHIERPAPPQISKSLLALPDPSPLPRQYNFTYIDVLVRDPFWVYVFWEIATSDRKCYEKKKNFDSYLLRVRLDDCPFVDENEAVLEAAIGRRDKSRYLNIPTESERKRECNHRMTCSYVVDLCAKMGQNPVALISSHPFRLPRALPLPSEGDNTMLEDEIMKLSGIEELEVLRNLDL
jgi:hypothetical protein